MAGLRNLGLCACAWMASGCIYANVHQPLSYRSPTPSDVQGEMGEEVSGSDCNHMVLWLVAWGNGGYEAALEDAKKKSGAALLADVRADSRLFNVLGIYQRSCTEVHGRVVR